MKRKIYYLRFDTLDSTNNWVKQHARALDSSHLTCVTALEQTAGRGRFKRAWVSPSGKSVLATLFFCLPKTSSITCNLGQVLSLSCCEILEKRGFSPQIRWPNDLLLEGKKVAGILCETVELDEALGIVLGIGINVNMTDAHLARIDQPATSLAALSGHTWELEEILEPLLQQFLVNLERLEEEGFAAFHQHYLSRLAFKSTPIVYSDGSQNVTGRFHSIHLDGRLCLQLPDGRILSLSAGETRGVNSPNLSPQ